MKKNYSTTENIFINDSQNQSFVFFKDDNNNLIFNQVNTEDSSTIIDKKVLDFSATIDENNKLHLLYLRKRGELIYCIYSEKSWQKKLIGRFDIHSNKYKYLTLFVHKNTINILYVSANLINLNLWTIEHIIKVNDSWQKIIVANIFSEKAIDPFYIDSDEFGNIYLVYSGKEYNNYNIYYLFFNAFTKRWTNNPTKISSSVANNILPYIFTDSQNNVHILWYSSDNGDYLLNYKRYSSIGDSKFQWKEISLPQILGNNYHAIMFEKSNKLNIIYISQEEIFNLVSNDYGNTWYIDNKALIENYPIYLIRYYSLSSNKPQDKINHCFGYMNNGNISFYLHNIHENPKENSSEPEDIDFEKDNIDTDSPKHKVESTPDADLKELEKLKKTLLEMQNQLKTLKEDIELIKDKLLDIEEKSSKKGFLNFRW